MSLGNYTLKIARNHSTGDGVELLPYLFMLALQHQNGRNYGPNLSPGGGLLAAQSQICTSL